MLDLLDRVVSAALVVLLSLGGAIVIFFTAGVTVGAVGLYFTLRDAPLQTSASEAASQMRMSEEHLQTALGAVASALTAGQVTEVEVDFLYPGYLVLAVPALPLAELHLGFEADPSDVFSSIRVQRVGSLPGGFWTRPLSIALTRGLIGNSVWGPHTVRRVTVDDFGMTVTLGD